MNAYTTKRTFPPSTFRTFLMKFMSCFLNFDKIFCNNSPKNSTAPDIPFASCIIFGVQSTLSVPVPCNISQEEWNELYKHYPLVVTHFITVIYLIADLACDQVNVFQLFWYHCFHVLHLNVIISIKYLKTWCDTLELTHHWHKIMFGKKKSHPPGFVLNHSVLHSSSHCTK